MTPSKESLVRDKFKLYKLGFGNLLGKSRAFGFRGQNPGIDKCSASGLRLQAPPPPQMQTQMLPARSGPDSCWLGVLPRSFPASFAWGGGGRSSKSLLQHLTDPLFAVPASIYSF